MRVALPVMAVVALIGFMGPVYAADTTRSPYVGQQSRAIKALSGEDIEALRNGDGMGLAKATELNGYPGPRHVLALIRELKLTESQAAQVTTIRDRMSAAAKPLGDELIDRERALDRLFAEREITAERLTIATAAIGDLQGRLRAVHLAAHLETRVILSAEQLAQHEKLRGYAGTGTPNRDHSTGRHH